MSRYDLTAKGSAPRWPVPVLSVWWVGDYTDIRERIQRTGRLDIAEELWPADSEDGYGKFCSRHGSYNFREDWREANERYRERQERAARRARERASTVAQREQERWEAEQRERRAKNQAQADREWAEAEAKQRAEIEKQATEAAEKAKRELEAARAFWSARDAGYAGQPYFSVTIGTGGTIEGVALAAGKTYWVPKTIHTRLTAKAQEAARQAQAIQAVHVHQEALHDAEALRRAHERQAEVEAAQQALRLRMAAAKRPSVELLALLAIPAPDLTDDGKVAIAEALERLFAARGAGPLLVAHGREAEVAVLTPRALALAKYAWYRDNLGQLGRMYPPPIL